MRLRSIIFPTVNILIALALASVFFIAGQNIVQTFAVADMAALNNLQPQPADYLWKVNIEHAALDRNKVRIYADYYEHLLKVFPNLGDAYGILGYCYHYLNDDTQAISSLKTAINEYPDYFWNYYDLAAIYINEARYQEASLLFQKALSLSPMTSIKRMFTSQFVYLPLLGTDIKGALQFSAKHLNDTYRSCFVLEQILLRSQRSQNTQEVFRNIKPELYAF